MPSLRDSVPFLEASGRTEVVRFPVAPFPNPQRDGAVESMFRKGRETLRQAQGRLLRLRSGQAMGHPSRGGVGLQQVSHRAFSPVRNDKIFWGLWHN